MLNKPKTRPKQAAKPEPKQQSKTGNKLINICSWNIRRGLLIREEELKEMIKTKNLNIIFLVETDTTSVNSENDYKVPGFKTIVQNKKKESDVTRVVCLLDEKWATHIIVRTDLTSPDFPSLWVELENDAGKNILCGGFYREWAPKGDKTVEAQVKSMRIFTGQMETASKENKSILILGDANLCSMKWDYPGFLHKQISDELRETLLQCGLELSQIGTTYTADRLSAEGNEITSALDHVYISKDLVPNTKCYKLDCSATDHLPIVACTNLFAKLRIKKEEQKTVEKRSMKNFTKTRWVDCLRNQDWKKVSDCSGTEEKAEEFTRLVNLALDECAPRRRVKIRKNFKPGLSEKAKKLMLERDLTRSKIPGSSKEQKEKLKTKYKQLRNRTITQIRKDTIQMNGEKIGNAKNEGETWRIINEIIKPKSDHTTTINGPNGEVSNEQEVADMFNAFFVKKVEDLKDKIDPNLVQDPLVKVREKVKNKNLKFKLKPTTPESLKKVMKKMAKKKSKGKDGIPQDCLLLGQEVLASPLTDVVNSSITTGTFPVEWKEAIVVPILKKGDAKELKNYRPVSCLVAASKVLEKVVCDQLTRFAEVHGLLPSNQHGFRAQRSTMTALSSMQKEWIKNTEEGLMTGILVWDLSSAFDTLDIDLFIEKIEIYGADATTKDWFRSFLTGRTQRVRMGSSLSSPLALASGVPQGGILSPMIFTLYTSDMELWLEESCLFNYADDTTTDSKGPEAIEVIANLEKNAKRVLQFMSSNGLVANQAKTEFLVLNERKKDRESPILNSVTVGDVTVKRSSHTKLLGVIIEDSQEWVEHHKSLRTSLNQRLFVIRRIMRQIPKSKLMGVVHCLWVSKLRYGLQLSTKIRISNEDAIPAGLKTLQTTQNRMLRVLNGTRIKDMISTSSMLKKFGLLSVNQLAAKIKLMEVWKSINKVGYPIRLEPYKPTSQPQARELRKQPNRIFNDRCKLKRSEQSFHVDAARIWNISPPEIKAANNINAAKKAIDIYCKSLPV